MHRSPVRITRFVRFALIVASAALGTLASRSAYAVDKVAAASIDKPAERRSGVVLSLAYGPGLAGSSGYPNSASKIGDPNYFSDGGLLFGSTGSMALMGALADYINFGLWGGGGTYSNSNWRSSGFGGGFRVEAFPFFGCVPALRDFGIAGQFGVGGTTLATTRTPAVQGASYPTASGVQSHIGVGVFHEWSLGRFLGGHFALGPSLQYDVITSRSIERHGAWVGARFVFYGGM